MRADQSAAGCSHLYMQWRLTPTVKLVRAQRRSAPPCAGPRAHRCRQCFADENTRVRDRHP
eukprot:3399407-Prymnesium_polylepis.1